jgi:hypothetical protein
MEKSRIEREQSIIKVLRMVKNRGESLLSKLTKYPSLKIVKRIWFQCYYNLILFIINSYSIFLLLKIVSVVFFELCVEKDLLLKISKP